MPHSSFSKDRNPANPKDQTFVSSTPTDSLSQPISGPDYKQLDPSLLSNLNPSQVLEIKKFISQAIAHEVTQKTADLSINHNQLESQDFTRKKRKSKLIDIRFVIDLLFSRFYVVLMVGKDIRKGQRSYPTSRATKAGNMIAAFILIVAMNLLISAILLLGLYLLKSALNIDLMPGHFSDQLEILKQ